jgi:photosystem II stability/assembly factor-like uncharacterized protein
VQFTDVLHGTIVGYRGLILCSTDGGTTWNPQVSTTTVELHSIAFADPNTATVVGGDKTILRTTNAGTSWLGQTIPTGFGTVMMFSGVCFGDSKIGFIVGKKDTLRDTTDVTSSFRESLIWRSTNSGTSWSRLVAVNRSWLYAVSFSSSTAATAVGEGGTILRSTDNGDTWIPTGGVTNASLLGVCYVTSSIGIAVGEGGTILRTTNGGGNWTVRPSGTANALRGVSFADRNNAFAIGDSMAILQSTDGGLNWMSLSSGSYSSFYAASFVDSAHGIIIGEGGAILSTTPGASVVSVEDDRTAGIPNEPSLAQNFPNPFNPSTAISFQLSALSWITLDVFDVLGRKVATLIDGTQSPGAHIVKWDGSALPSGVYFYRLRARDALTGSERLVETKKMLLIR